MLRRYSFALRPGWVIFHLVVTALVVTMILLGRWQLHVSEHKHFSLQNFGYAIQWWLFSAFALFFWWRIVRDAARRRAGEPGAPGEPGEPGGTGETRETPAQPAPAPSEPVAYRRYVMPTAPQPSDDPVHAAYNDYLARLAAKDAEEKT